MMNDLNTGRRRLFWMLKKWSSYSVWEYHARLMDVFVAHYEEAVNTWPSGEAPPAENLHAAYIAQAAFGKGLAMLRRGQRNVWLAREDGYLLEAANAVSKATAAITSREINKYDGGEQGLPLYAEWTDRLEALRVLKERTKVYGVKLIAQPTADYADRKPTAWIDTVEVDITAWLQRNAGDFGSVKPGGEESPVSPPILITSGEPIPKDGIWELVHPDFPPYTTEALNYFVSGISAPWCSAPDIGPTIVRAAVWRLVWEDTRYLDGVIPDELHYLAD